MKIIVYPDQPAGGNLVLNGYVLSESGSNIPTTPDFYVDCGQVWFGSSYHPNFVAGRSGKIYCQIDGHKIIRSRLHLLLRVRLRCFTSTRRGSGSLPYE